ncbi:MAG: hypothetical protein PUC97_01250 [bacterium]|nr:hypothetical protein [bacterium]
MKYLKSLLEATCVAKKQNQNIRFQKGKMIINVPGDLGIFNLSCIANLLSSIAYIHGRYHNVNMPIIINIDCKFLEDKLTLALLECICYSLIVDYGHYVSIGFRLNHTIQTEGISSSPLGLLGSNKQDRIKLYIDKFKEELYKSHYRRLVIEGSDRNSDLSIVLGDIGSFLKHLGIEEEYRVELSEVVTELICNACEHGKTDCLVDIDVTKEYFKEGSAGRFCGINVAVINFSNIPFEDAMKDKMDKDYPEDSRYSTLLKARDYHSKHFSDTYLEEDFYKIAAFQDRISGRIDKVNSGGVGLTKLISSLEKKSDATSCYMITGRRRLVFDHAILEYDSNGWIGFNLEKSFLNGIPQRGILNPISFYMPGTAYNLNFVVKKG